jgi:hypothetical protein
MKAAAFSAGNRGVLRPVIFIALLAIPFAATSARATVIVNGGSASAVDSIAFRSLYLDPLDPPALIPEPATALLLGAGIAALACAGRGSLTNTLV